MQNVHEEKNYRRNKGNQHSHNPDIWADDVAYLQNLINDPLKFGHVSLLDELILYLTILNLLLSEINVVWEKF